MLIIARAVVPYRWHWRQAIQGGANVQAIRRAQHVCSFDFVGQRGRVTYVGLCGNVIGVVACYLGSAGIGLGRAPWHEYNVLCHFWLADMCCCPLLADHRHWRIDMSMRWPTGCRRLALIVRCGSWLVGSSLGLPTGRRCLSAGARPTQVCGHGSIFFSVITAAASSLAVCRPCARCRRLSRCRGAQRRLAVNGRAAAALLRLVRTLLPAAYCCKKLPTLSVSSIRSRRAVAAVDEPCSDDDEMTSMCCSRRRGSPTPTNSRSTSGRFASALAQLRRSPTTSATCLAN